jgi:peroxiredoxin
VKTAALVVFLCLFAVFSGALKTELRRDKSPLGTVKIGEPMPDFTLVDSTGRPVRLSDMTRDHKIVMVNFWATWCGPCRVEMPGFEKIYRDKKNDGFIILAITEDKERPKLDEYLKNKPVTFPVLIDSDNALAKQLKIESLPTTILIGEGGKVKQVHEGVQPYLSYAVEGALKKPGEK